MMTLDTRTVLLWTSITIWSFIHFNADSSELLHYIWQTKCSRNL